jgi:hypothetical protein
MSDVNCKIGIKKANHLVFQMAGLVVELAGLTSKNSNN